MSSMAVVL